MKITHIINPVKVKESSDLFKAQPITFKTMREAKEFAKDVVDVSLVTTQYSEDRDIIPDYFYKTQDLERSVLDIDNFDVNKKLPLIKDIFRRAVDFDEDADYIIYSNVDIALYPHFYTSIYEFIVKGYDGICINRNTLLEEGLIDFNISELYSIKGKEHEGIDCFVIKKSIVPEMILESSIIGTGPVGLIIANNLVHLCKNFIWLRKSNLTFHIGDDKSWLLENISKKSLLYFSFLEFKKILEIVKKNETNEVKHEVIMNSLQMVDYFIYNKKFMKRPNNRKALALYSDGDFQKLLELI